MHLFIIQLHSFIYFYKRIFHIKSSVIVPQLCAVLFVNNHIMRNDLAQCIVGNVVLHLRHLCFH